MIRAPPRWPRSESSSMLTTSRPSSTTAKWTSDFASIAARPTSRLIGTADSDLSYNSLDTFSPGPTLNYGDTGQVLGIKHLTNFRKEAVLYCVESTACSSETAIAEVGRDEVRRSKSSTLPASRSQRRTTRPSAWRRSKRAPTSSKSAMRRRSPRRRPTDCAAQGWDPPEVVAATAARPCHRSAVRAA